MATPFCKVYNNFLDKITDDMYVELTPEDTAKDMRHLLIESIPGFEFPRQPLDYTIEVVEIDESEVVDQEDFILGVTWHDLPEDGEEAVPIVLVERSYFHSDLTLEEINILALNMMNLWLQRQITSIENTRMKYSGSDFKFSSQANHMAKLLQMREDTRRQSFHMQRLYKRREMTEDGLIKSTWDYFGKHRATGD